MGIRDESLDPLELALPPDDPIDVVRRSVPPSWRQA